MKIIMRGSPKKERREREKRALEQRTEILVQRRKKYIYIDIPQA